MKVYDTLIEEIMSLINEYDYKELKVDSNNNWTTLDNNEFLLKNEVAFELGSRMDPCTAFNCVTSTKELINESRILLIGKDLNEIKKDTNFSRVSFLNIDDIKDPDKAYRDVKKIDFERFRIIPEGYMISTSSVDNKENVRISKTAIKNGLDFAKIGNTFINRYKQISGVNDVWMIFIVGDFDKTNDLVRLSRRANDITNAFEHIMKNIILDCSICPLETICESVEELRELHFEQLKKNNKEG